jgi:hypothetical protein
MDRAQRKNAKKVMSILNITSGKDLDILLDCLSLTLKSDCPKSNPPRAKRRAIKSRDDLSFTKRDSIGRLMNWSVPRRVNSWNEHIAIGNEFFDEIVELAKNNPGEAFRALLYSGHAMMRLGDTGHAEGFTEMWAAWAICAITANLKPNFADYNHKSLAIEPREGIDYWFNRNR